jgi:hypothetical protein
MRAPNFRIAVLGGYLSIIGIAVFSGQARAGAIQTKAFLLEHCPSVQPPQNQERGKFAFGATLTGIFAPRLVDGIVDLVDKALKSAAEARTYPFDAPPVVGDFYEVSNLGKIDLNPKHECLVLVRGDFSGEKIDAALLQKEPWFKQVQADNSSAKDSPLKSLTGVPQFYGEFKRVPYKSSHFTLHPYRIFIGDFAHGSPFKFVRDYKIAVTYSEPVSGKAFASGEFTISNLATGASLSACGSNDWSSYESYAPWTSEKGSCTGSLAQFSTAFLAVRPPDDDLNAAVEKNVSMIEPYDTLATFDLKEKKQSDVKRAWDAFDRLDEPKCNKNPGSTNNELDCSLLALPKPPAVKTSDLKGAVVDDYCKSLGEANASLDKSRKRYDPLCDSFVDAQNKLVKAQKDAQDRKEAEWRKKMRKLAKAKACGWEAGVDNRLASCAGTKETRTGLFELKVVLSEVRQPSPFGLFLSETFSSAKPDIKTALKAELPAARRAADEAEQKQEATAAESAREALTAYKVTEFIVTEKQLAVDAAKAAVPVVQTTLNSAESALFQAKAAANKAFRKAYPKFADDGMTIPYPEVETR